MLSNKILSELTENLSTEIEQLNIGKSPSELYDPIKYILSLGGKRLRPLLVLLSYNLFKDDPLSAIKPATAIEVFHNFTLMHDDIMDEAPIRRGKSTVHEKWNRNIAILSGDVMLVNAYQLLLNVDTQHFKIVIEKFNKCASDVCEGQQLDMNFENRDDVSLDEYLNMIRLKTAVLLGFSMELGAIIANADRESQQLLYDFGTNIGIGFQLKDDLLDVYADQSKFGKQAGGDIIANKKTYLLIKALELAKGVTKIELQRWINKSSFDKMEKFNAVKSIYDKLEIKSSTEKIMDDYFKKGFLALEKLDVTSEKKSSLIDFTTQLINREK